MTGTVRREAGKEKHFRLLSARCKCGDPVKASESDTQPVRSWVCESSVNYRVPPGVVGVQEDNTDKRKRVAGVWR